jgi:Flp pilus assembly protein TadD
MRPFSTSRNHHAWVTATLLMGLLVLVASLYFPFLSGDFQFDDKSNILESKAITDFDLSFSSFSNLITNSPPPSKGRPVAVLSFAINGLFTGLSETSLRSVNLLIHLLNTLLVYFLLREIVGLTNRSKRTEITALFATAFWALNPVNTHAVTYIVQRMTILQTTFFLSGCLLYCTYRRRGEKRVAVYLLTLLPLFLLSLGTKESAASFPLVLLLIEWCFFKPPGKQTTRNRILLATLSSIIAIYLIIGLIFVFGDSSELANVISKKGFTPFQRLLTQPKVLIWYLSLTLFPLPSRLNFDIDFPASTGILAPPDTLLAILLWFAVITIAIRHKKSDILLSFMIFWYLFTSAIESSFLMLDMAYLHRIYLPSIIPVLYFSDWIARRGEYFSRRAGHHFAWGKYVLIAVVLLSLCYGTLVRNSILSSSLKLWEDTVSKSPQKARAHYNLGFTYQEHSKISAAEIEYRKAIELNPAYYLPHASLVSIYMSQNRYPEAMSALENALEHGDTFADVQHLAGRVYDTFGDYEQALHHYSKALNGKYGHNTVDTLWYMARVYRVRGDVSAEADILKKFLNMAAGNDRRIIEAQSRLGKLIRRP